MSDDLIPVPIPSLVAILVAKRDELGRALTEVEVVDTRDKVVCMMMPREVARQMEEKRGYRELDLENVWEDWLGFIAWYDGEMAQAAPER